MIHGFLKVGAATPKIKVADPKYNAEKIIEMSKQAAKEGVKVLIFPELCLTGYTCEDLFLQEVLLRNAKEQLLEIAKETAKDDIVLSVGLPFVHRDQLYNTAAVLHGGRVLGIVPKRNLPNYAEFYEARHFNRGNERAVYTDLDGEQVLFGSQILFTCSNVPNLKLAIEICQDLWVAIPPSSEHALAGATLIANLSASDETTGKSNYRRDLITNQSARLICGYIYSSAGEGESSTDLVFGGHNLIAENGSLLKESERFKTGFIVSEIDLNKLVGERRRMVTYNNSEDFHYDEVLFSYESIEENGLPMIHLTRSFAKTPFVPSVKKDRDERCEEILTIQAMGLKKRLEHIHGESVVLGISGGLDSTLAILVVAKTFDMLNLPRKNIMAVTMPCFGTTDRTYQNAVSLTTQLGATLLEIPIRDSVIQHLKDIGHDVDNHDVTYENAQARERTQVLMDVANQNNAIVIGTGDMSELALGWATYNGDHMSMYGVNASVPKTLVRYLVLYYAETVQEEELRDVLFDILDTPVSPELLPPKEGEISQKTEDIVGPYELHDFFMYYILRYGFSPSKIFRLAVLAFGCDYEKDTIYKWITVFYKRFFAQQFKRSCLPDGPKVGSVAVSPRGDLRMPSDACATIWLQELEAIRYN